MPGFADAIADRPPGPSCTTSACPFFASEVRLVEHFYKRHASRALRSYMDLFTPRLGDAPTGYSAHDGPYSMRLVALQNGTSTGRSALLAGIDQLLHERVADDVCGELARVAGRLHLVVLEELVLAARQRVLAHRARLRVIVSRVDVEVTSELMRVDAKNGNSCFFHLLPNFSPFSPNSRAFDPDG